MGEDSQGFMRLCERQGVLRRGFARICQTLGDDLQGFTLGEDLQGFMRLWERICKDS